MAGMCTRTGADLAIGCAASRGCDDAAGGRDRRRRGGSRVVGAGGDYGDDGDDGQQGGHPRRHPGTGAAGVALRHAVTHEVQVLSCPGGAVE